MVLGELIYLRVFANFGEDLVQHVLNKISMPSMSNRDPITSGNKTIYESLNPAVGVSSADGYVNIASG